MYLSTLVIENYRGIQKLSLDFDPHINIIIGENGCGKSAVIDAIRILYSLGEPIKRLSISKDDFFETIQTDDQGVVTVQKASKLSFTYIFRNLSAIQKGAFYEYMVLVPGQPDQDHAKIQISYELTESRHPQFSYNTGNIEGQRADFKTFELFQHYYLEALRDSTKDLLTTRSSILGQVIGRHIQRQGSHTEFEEIIKGANDKLLEREEVIKTRDGINSNLAQIFKRYADNKVGLQIEQSRAELIVNIIKPFLPHDKLTLRNTGFHLWQNSLGFNNLIYIATVLGDIKEQIQDDSTPHYALLIEEPEAHLHPQIQLNLFNFLKLAGQFESSQLFITSHSPTLTSKVPFPNLILLDRRAYRISNLFADRASENILEAASPAVPVTDSAIQNRKNQLERYIDVTKSQLFFAKAILMVEGISEELLMNAFAQVAGFALEDFRIEIVNVDGTSFHPFLYLFNSGKDEIRIQKNVAILTDGDRFPMSKDLSYKFESLIENNYEKLNELVDKISAAPANNRSSNLASLANGQPSILIGTSHKTLEHELALMNVPSNRLEIPSNFLIKYVEQISSERHAAIMTYINSLPTDLLSPIEIRRAAILVWKSLPSKAEFAQNFSIHILNNLPTAKSSLIIPDYIMQAFNHLK